MKSLFTLILLALSSSAFAGEGRNVVVCGETSFSDLRGIAIRETDLKGQYQIVETLYDSAKKVSSQKLSPVFGMNEIEKSELPELTSWNGYVRKLVRYGRDNYAIEYFDECTGGMSSISCKDAF